MQCITMATTSLTMTAEQLLDAQDLWRCEQIKGELIEMTPAGADHRPAPIRLSLRLGNH